MWSLLKTFFLKSLFGDSFLLPIGQRVSAPGDLLGLHCPALTLSDLFTILVSQVVTHGHRCGFQLVSWSFKANASCEAIKPSGKECEFQNQTVPVWIPSSMHTGSVALRKLLNLLCSMSSLLKWGECDNIQFREVL